MSIEKNDKLYSLVTWFLRNAEKKKEFLAFYNRLDTNLGVIGSTELVKLVKLRKTKLYIYCEHGMPHDEHNKYNIANIRNWAKDVLDLMEDIQAKVTTSEAMISIKDICNVCMCSKQYIHILLEALCIKTEVKHKTKYLNKQDVKRVLDTFYRKGI